MKQPPLRVGYADGAHREVLLDAVPVTAGSAPDCAIPLAVGASPVHVTLQRMAGGVILRVAAGAPRVYVNARPVRELALLRVGDTISVGTNTLLLRSDADALGPPSALGERIAPPAGSASLVGLRVVAGPLCGQRIAIDGGENLDALRLPGVGGCLRLRPQTDHVAFDYRAGHSAADEPYCNGLHVARGRLVAGDQIAWGKHRMVLEMPLPLPSVPPPPVASTAAPPVASSTTRGGAGVWWLIGTAALMALVISILLFVRT